MCCRSRVHDKELKNSGCVLSASAWTVRDQQPHWLPWHVIQLRIGQKENGEPRANSCLIRLESSQGTNVQVKMYKALLVSLAPQAESMPSYATYKHSCNYNFIFLVLN